MSKKLSQFTLTLLIFALVSNACVASISASKLMPADCMMSMMANGDEMDMDCECSTGEMQCQRCSLDVVTAGLAVLIVDDMNSTILASHTHHLSLRHVLDDTDIGEPSPPPIS